MINNLVNDLKWNSNCDRPGAWVIPVPKSGLECNLGFETECPEPTDGQRSNWAGILEINSSKDSSMWSFEAHHNCIPRHGISRNRKKIVTECVYDPDYYDSRWSAEAPTCQGQFTQKISFFWPKLGLYPNFIWTITAILWYPIFNQNFDFREMFYNFWPVWFQFGHF